MEKTAEICVVFEGSVLDPFLIIFKPSGMPSAPLAENDGVTALDKTLQLFPELRQVRGKKAVEYGLVHRLDTETSGLLLIARTQSCYDALQDAQQNDNCIKKYTAFCVRQTGMLQGFPELPTSFNPQTAIPPLRIKSLFRPYGARGFSVRPVLPPETGDRQSFAQKKAGRRLYSTLIESIGDPINTRCEESASLMFRAECALTRGFRHQVRCHLAWLGYPIAGDRIYNPDFADADKPLQLFAHTIEFPHPLTGKHCCFTDDFLGV